MVCHKPCQIIFLVCQLIKQVYVIKKRGVTARAGYERVKVIEQLTRFGVQMHCVSRDKTVFCLSRDFTKSCDQGFAWHYD